MLYDNLYRTDFNELGAILKARYPNTVDRMMLITQELLEFALFCWAHPPPSTHSNAHNSARLCRNSMIPELRKRNFEAQVVRATKTPQLAK